MNQFCLHFDFGSGSGFFFQLSRFRIWIREKKYWILIPGFLHRIVLLGESGFNSKNTNLGTRPDCLEVEPCPKKADFKPEIIIACYFLMSFTFYTFNCQQRESK